MALADRTIGSMISPGAEGDREGHGSLAPPVAPCPGDGRGGRQPPHHPRPRLVSDPPPLNCLPPHNLPIFKIIGFLWEAGNIRTERTLYSRVLDVFVRTI